MFTIKLNTEFAESFLPKESVESGIKKALSHLESLKNGSGAGGEMTGWVKLPTEIESSLLEDCKRIAISWRDKLDVVVVIGIGGSYLGAKCTLEALSPSFSPNGKKGFPHIVFAGCSLSEEYMSDLLDYLKDKSYGLVVISKSGTTIEPAIAFRLLRNNMIERFGKEETQKRVVTITDRNSALKKMSDINGYYSLPLPTNIGGRYSVLSAVGLLPISIAGFDIDSLIDGAKSAMDNLLRVEITNPALKYAVLRNLFYREGKKIEIFINYNPKLKFFGEWLKQLFGESEGKMGKGLFPASSEFTTDLHSLGQYIQEGERIMFETAIIIENKSVAVNIPNLEDNYDGLDYIVGKSIEEINKCAEEGTKKAHFSGGVPNISVSIDKLDEYNLGAIFYFFEVSCAISAYILGVNPFDQPGVEVYKKNLYKLLES